MTLIFIGIIVGLLFYTRSLQDKVEQLEYVVFDLEDTLTLKVDDLTEMKSKYEAAVMANKAFKEHHDELKEELIKAKADNGLDYANSRAVFYDQQNDTLTQGEDLIFIGEL